MMGIGKFACVFFILIFSIGLTQSAFAQSSCPPDYVTVFNECVYAFAEPPNPPSGLVAVAISPTRVDLSWNAPTDDGSSLIIGYRIDGV